MIMQFVNTNGATSSTDNSSGAVNISFYTTKTANFSLTTMKYNARVNYYSKTNHNFNSLMIKIRNANMRSQSYAT